jgi:hypothetical protein
VDVLEVMRGMTVSKPSAPPSAGSGEHLVRTDRSLTASYRH